MLERWRQFPSKREMEADGVLFPVVLMLALGLCGNDAPLATLYMKIRDQVQS